jgi:hypothetical protein
LRARYLEVRPVIVQPSDQLLANAVGVRVERIEHGPRVVSEFQIRRLADPSRDSDRLPEQGARLVITAEPGGAETEIGKFPHPSRLLLDVEHALDRTGGDQRVQLNRIDAFEKNPRDGRGTPVRYLP